MTQPPRFLLASLVAGTCAMGGTAGDAQAQVDPTRPTFVSPMAPAMPLGGAAPPAALPGGPGGGLLGVRPSRPATPPMPRVSSVVVASPEFSSAVIDDRVYRVGDKVPQLGTLVAIDGAGVSLRSGSATRRLALWSRKAAVPARGASSVESKGPMATSSASPAEAKE